MVDGPLIYVVRADFEEGFEHDHHDWYLRRHAPDVLGVGFWSARAYYALGSKPLMWNHYEIESTKIFHDPIYNGMHANDPDLPMVVSKLIGRSVSVYTQIEVVNAADERLGTAPTLRGPVVSCMRFDCDEATAAAGWFRDKLVPMLGRPAGRREIRLLEQREQHPKWPTTEPRWYATVEWASQDVLDAASGLALLGEAMAALPTGSAKSRVDVITKQYALVREDLFD